MVAGDDMNVNKGLYTVNDVAELLNVHPRTVRRYLHDGILKGKKIGGQWRFTLDDIKSLHGQNISDMLEISGNKGEGFPEVNGNKQTLEVCSVVDFNLDNIDKIKNTADMLFNAANKSGGKLSFKFEFLSHEDKARYTLWGAPSIIAEVLLKIQ